MTHCTGSELANFFVVGINYKKSHAALRGQFAVNDSQYTSLLSKALSCQLRDVFVLSTCNRTEVYGFAESADKLIDLLCSETKGTKEAFAEQAYIKNGMSALTHLFYVGAGLDSQIPGDYEIIGQLKQAVQFAKDRSGISSFMDRIINFVIQASKSVKNETCLSSGTVSVSFAAVQYVKKHVANVAGKRILLVGVGKIGSITCRNLADYLPAASVTLINRSTEKAEKLAAELQLQYATMEELPDAIATADIILVATNAHTPSVTRQHLEGKGAKLVIDFSIPCNVEAEARELPGIELINVDELSKLSDATLHKRKADIPAAESIIARYISEFTIWNQMRKHVPVLQAVKVKLHEIYAYPLFSMSDISFHVCTTSAEKKIQKVINGMARKMRDQHQHGCYYIEAINEFIR